MTNLRIERDGPVAVMIWAHEEQNRFTTPFLSEIIAAFRELKADKTAKAVVVTSGLPKYFSTGLFLEWIMAEGAKDPASVPAFFRTITTFMREVTGFPKPLIAAINGHAVAMGAIICACMDYRYMTAERGLVRLPEVQINIPFTPSMTAIFKDIMPARAWRDMAYTGERFTAQQAFEMGYIDKLCAEDQLLPEAVALGKKLAGFQTGTYAAIKLENRREVLRTIDELDPPHIEKMLTKLGAVLGN